jgi:hypothetical protein
MQLYTKETSLFCIVIAQSVKNSVPFIEPKDSVLHLQDSTRGPYPESHESIVHPYTLFLPFSIAEVMPKICPV